MTKENIQKLLEGCKTEKQVISKLTKEKIQFENVSAEYGYMNLRIYNADGYIRIYQHKKEIRIQQFTPCKMEYSGIPTFFATNSYF